MGVGVHSAFYERNEQRGMICIRCIRSYISRFGMDWPRSKSNCVGNEEQMWRCEGFDMNENIGIIPFSS